MRTNLINYFHELETTTVTQIPGLLTDSRDGRCALGVIMDTIVKSDPDRYEFQITGTGSSLVRKKSNPLKSPVDVIQDYLGISCAERDKIAEMNNGGDTFKEIAAWGRTNLLTSEERDVFYKMKEVKNDEMVRN